MLNKNGNVRGSKKPNCITLASAAVSVSAKDNTGERLSIVDYDTADSGIKQTASLSEKSTAAHRGASRGRPHNLTGQKFNRLTAIKIAGKKGRQNLWLCKCECGKHHETTAALLIKGVSTSCGCYMMEKITEHGYLKGGKRPSEYDCWLAIKQRCYNENNPEYKNYGERGIKMCDEWLKSFDIFIRDMGFKPSKSHSIDRINVNKGYYPENCRWTTIKIQNANKRQTRWITAFGETLPLTEMAKKHNINPITLSYRLRFVNPEIALTQKLHARGAYARNNA
ncbi:hypothetical protein [Xenorhabdus lircayensis]|uniref:Uncharacterized protein n=1 Tax=Xenorhabdus lircayensis TaxID=2763499 RepID=A0ABS0U8D6_9GAMM|nr:hypothetical protein [Xenorhabdus lircayensis]MBI6550143.1 hypothetical protein [Xenorhabdus lircayensis]